MTDKKLQETSSLSKRDRFRKRLERTVTVILVASSISLLVSLRWMPVYRIYSSSMSPALEKGQIVVAIRSDDYMQGDLVAFNYGNKVLIKRVIAGPEDMVSLKQNGDVYINGMLLDEPYVDEKPNEPYVDDKADEPYVGEKSFGDSDMEFPLRVPKEHWFLMGDNRQLSMDSRDSQIGCVSQEAITGKVVMRVWPLNQLQKIGDWMELKQE